MSTKNSTNADYADVRAEAYADDSLNRLCGCGKWDSSLGEDLWCEIERVISIPAKTERMDAIEDMTLLDLMKKAVERRTAAMLKNGDFG